jgi:hypothetical protein
MCESSGGVILEESILDVLVDKELARAGLSVSTDRIATEREIVLQGVAEESQVSRDQAAGLIEDLRRARGLGPVRYNAQLLRNAKLRALVQDSVTVSADEVELATRLNFGERLRVRMARFRTQAEANSIAGVAGAMSQGPREAEFARVGAGPLVISPEDPALATSVQAALRSVREGEVTPVLGDAEGFVVVSVEARINATTPPSPAEVERRVRLRKERIAMDQLSNRMLAGAQVTVFDESLRWSWEKAR